MKWIIILATVLSCANSFADEDMPIGDTAPVENTSGWGTPSPQKSKAKPKADNVMPKGTDYAPAQDLLLSAMSLIGVKYTWGGNTPESGLDCSGFIKYVFQNSMNITLPRTAFEMAQTGRTIDKSELKPGDLVFFNTLGRTFSHVGIYLGDNRFIHSPRAGRSVEVANMGLNYWQNRFNGGRRVADGSGGGLNVNAMLAASSNRSQSAVASNTKPQCKKVTTGKGKKKRTVLQCEKPNNAKPTTTAKKPAAKSSTKKPSTKTSKTKTSAKTTKSSAKTSTKKKAK